MGVLDMICERCGEYYEVSTSICPYCGGINVIEKKKKNNYLRIFLLIILLLVLFDYYGLTNRLTNKKKFFSKENFNVASNDIKEENLENTGIIKKMQVILYDSDGNSKISTEEYYDENENITKKTSQRYSSKDGLRDTYTLYTYDDNGLLELEIEYYEEDDQFIKKTEYINSDGHCIEKDEYLSENNVANEKTYYTYDDNGNNTSEIMYYSDGIIGKNIQMQYDDNNNMIEYARLNYDYTVSSYSNMEYDINGRCIVERSFDGKGNLETCVETKYNDNKSYEKTYYNNNYEVTKKQVMTFDEEENKEIIYGYYGSNDNIENMTIIEYDEFYNPTEFYCESYDSDGVDADGSDRISYVYEYYWK